MDVGFLGAAQIDRYANINTTVIGDYKTPSTRLPGAGGQYLYLREAWHPAVAFVYGWVLLLVTQTGGMAAVAVTLALYYRRLKGVAGSDSTIAAAASANAPRTGGSISMTATGRSVFRSGAGARSGDGEGDR